MQSAKLCLAAACVLATASARLSAQGFDGVIQFASYENHSDHPDTMTQITKGSKIRFEGMGRNGGAMIMDGTNRIILIPERKQYMNMPANVGEHAAAAEASKHRGTAERTGKTETIAGIPCEDWHYKGTRSDGTPEEGEACVAKGAGLMINRLSGGMAGHVFTAGGEAFAEAIRSGAGIMKVTNNGKISFVAVNAKATSVPDAMFAPPPDYTKMDMGSMRGPPRKP
jgi:copper(I)-binding protein